MNKIGFKKNDWLIPVICSLIMIVLFGAYHLWHYINSSSVDKVKVGFIYVGDSGTPYTGNFIKCKRELENKYGNSIEIVTRENVAEGTEKDAINSLIDEECDIIFGTSYGYADSLKKIAASHPNIQFCEATAGNANQDPFVSNYHTFMGHIYEGRYASGVVAGIKLKELIDAGIIDSTQAKIGYVAAFPYAEVISGYTAFLLGVRSVVADATMDVTYTNTWSSFSKEKKVAKELIADGCVIISQHSDTTGPAVACEEAPEDVTVFHVGYNQSMVDVAPTTSLVSSRINWTPYITEAVQAMFEKRKIEERIDATINGNDSGAGFDKGWVQMLDLNEAILPKETEEILQDTIARLENGKIEVFKGDYIGVDSFNENDVYDLRNGYKENETMSAPSFHYILKDIITIK